MNSLLPRLAQTSRLVLAPNRALSTDPLVPDLYSRSLRVMHFVMAGLVLGAVGTVVTATDQPKTPAGDARRGTLMFWHKSMGLAVAMLLPLRLGMRYSAHIPAPLPAPAVQLLAAQLTHLALYGGMLFMAITGVTMGYTSGRGMPFFFTTFQVDGKDPATAKQAYGLHKQFGHWWKLTIPLHFMGALAHAAQGQRIFARMNPFL
jgi:cytochrome b561